MKKMCHGMRLWFCRAVFCRMRHWNDRRDFLRIARVIVWGNIGTGNGLTLDLCCAFPPIPINRYFSVSVEIRCGDGVVAGNSHVRGFYQWFGMLRNDRVFRHWRGRLLRCLHWPCQHGASNEDDFLPWAIFRQHELAVFNDSRLRNGLRFRCRRLNELRRADSLGYLLLLVMSECLAAIYEHHDEAEGADECAILPLLYVFHRL